MKLKRKEIDKWGQPIHHLPKQWNYWCEKNNLTCYTFGHKGYVMRGAGFHWRVNCHGVFQRGDSIETFDKWALCTNIYSGSIPQTEKEFTEFVKAAKEHWEKNNELPLA